ncbi:MAG: PAS domain-containing protein [Synechococcales bacterium]|nr:PAS domain-containing protein [Synechococcales bacterium]
MFLVWGGDRLFFYNDAYLSILPGSKTVSPFGQPVSGSWRADWNGVWLDVEWVFTTGQALQRQHPLLSEDGNGRTGMPLYTWSYSVLADETGQVGGVFATGCPGMGDVQRLQARAAEQPQADSVRAEQAWLAIKIGRLGTWRYNLQTNLLYLDERMREIWGEPDDAETIPLPTGMARIHPQDRDRVAIAISAALDPSSSGMYEIDYRIRWDDGTERWISANGQAQFVGEGALRTPVDFFGTALDITERKRAEEALRESEARFRQMTDTAPILVWMSGTDKLCNYFNQSWLNFTGRTPEEEMGNGWVEGVHPDDFQRCVETYTRAFDARRPFEMDYRLRHASGQYRWIMDVGVPRFTAEGEFVGYIGSCFDIHDRKQAEESLRESEERFRTLADNISQFAWMADAAGWIFWYNHRWFEYTGTTLEDMQGWGWQAVHHPDYVGRVVEKFRSCIEAGEVWEDTFPLRSKDGHYGWFLSRAIPIRDERGNVLRWFGTNTDITEHKQFEQTLEQRSQELTRLNQMLSSLTSDLKRRNQDLNQFAYVVSHDLKAPLRGIRNLAQWLKEDLGTLIPADSQEQLDLLMSRVDRMESLISGLLDYSRAGQRQSSAELVDVGELLRKITGSLSLPLGVTVQLTGRMPTFQTRRLVLSQVFANLISNAVSYGCPNQQGNVVVSVWEGAEAYEFAIADSGPGIAPSYHERIFNIFETLSTRDVPQSTGIGLSIVKKLVEEAGGTIRVESQLGAGATFYFTWPKPTRMEPAPAS